MRTCIAAVTLGCVLTPLGPASPAAATTTVDAVGHSLYSGQVTLSTTLSGGTYLLVDPVRGNGRTCDMNNGTTGCVTFTDADNVWGSGDQAAAVDAHYGAALTFDYFRDVHGHAGVFGDGRGVPSRVHYGTNFLNAFWDGTQLTYGDGNNRPPVSVDVVAHEWTHGVTDAVVPGGLEYAGESGGLHEATSDIFATMVEFSADNPVDPGDYTIGELVYASLPVRQMYDPALDGVSHSCWSTSTPQADPHYSSGVADHFFFNLAEGTGETPYGTSPVCGSAAGVTGIGRAAAERIWWRALATHFTSTTTYVDPDAPADTARAATLRAATDLYGQCSPQYRTVQAAWTAVNVAGADPACGP